MIMIPYLTRLKIKILKEELLYFLNKYNSMDHDGGRYNTTVDVLNERILVERRNEMSLDPDVSEDRYNDICENIYGCLEDYMDDYLKECIRSSLYLNELQDMEDYEDEWMDEAKDMLLEILQKDKGLNSRIIGKDDTNE